MLLYSSMVRSHLVLLFGDIEAWEKLQKRAIKILPSLKNLSYSETLKFVGYQPYTINV